MTPIAIILIILGVLLLLFLGFTFYAYYLVFYSPHKSQRIEERLPHSLVDGDQRVVCKQNISHIMTLPFEFVSTRSYDGLRLVARLYRGQPGAPVCLCFHGYRGAAIRDFSGVGSVLIEKGYNVILVDERAHFRSQGHTITYGVKERRDVLSWCEYALETFGSDAELRLFGVSMGAATVLLASSLDLPENVRSICADCPYNSPDGIIYKVSKEDYRLPADLIHPFIVTAAFLFGHFRLRGLSASEEVKKSKIPIQIMHGEADAFVPMYMSREVYEANPALIEYHTFPQARHGLSFIVDRERYLRLLFDFLERT